MSEYPIPIAHISYRGWIHISFLGANRKSLTIFFDSHRHRGRSTADHQKRTHIKFILDYKSRTELHNGQQCVYDWMNGLYRAPSTIIIINKPSRITKRCTKGVDSTARHTHRSNLFQLYGISIPLFCLSLRLPFRSSFAFNFTRKHNIAFLTLLVIITQSIDMDLFPFLDLTLSMQRWHTHIRTTVTMAFASFQNKINSKFIFFFFAGIKSAWLRCKTKTFIRFTFVGRIVGKTQSISWHRSENSYVAQSPITSHLTHVWCEFRSVCYFIEISQPFLSLSLPCSGTIVGSYFWCVNEHENKEEWKEDKCMSQVTPTANIKRNNAAQNIIYYFCIIQFNIHKIPWDWKHLFFPCFLSRLSLSLPAAAWESGECTRHPHCCTLRAFYYSIGIGARECIYCLCIVTQRTPRKLFRTLDRSALVYVSLEIIFLPEETSSFSL